MTMEDLLKCKVISQRTKQEITRQWRPKIGKVLSFCCVSSNCLDCNTTWLNGILVNEKPAGPLHGNFWTIPFIFILVGVHTLFPYIEANSMTAWKRNEPTLSHSWWPWMESSFPRFCCSWDYCDGWETQLVWKNDHLDSSNTADLFLVESNDDDF